MAISGNEPISAGNLKTVVDQLKRELGGVLLFDGRSSHATLSERCDNFSKLLVTVEGLFTSTMDAQRRTVLVDSNGGPIDFSQASNSLVSVSCQNRDMHMDGTGSYGGYFYIVTVVELNF